jgi:UDP-2-acetamido-3-amino-2,3-dideoxy-glucuronate N-acetyltransferase
MLPLPARRSTLRRLMIRVESGPKVPATPPGLAILGLGPWGRNLLRAFARVSACRVTIVCDRDPARLHAVEAPLGARRFAEADQALDDPDVSAVVIATPASDHVALAETALHRGRHVFVEKPMALDEDGAARLVELAGRLGRRLMVGHVLEHHPAVAEMERQVARGTIGKLTHLTSSRLSATDVRPEGSWWSLAPHDVSLAHRLLGGSARRIRVRRQGGDESELFVAHLAFDSGRTAEIEVGTGSAIKVRTTRLIGTHGCLELDDTRPVDKLRLCAGAPLLPSDHAGEGRPLPCPTDAPLDREASAFVRSLSHLEPVPGDGLSGLEVTRVLEAGVRSLEAGTWVTIPLQSRRAGRAPGLDAEQRA